MLIKGLLTTLFTSLSLAGCAHVISDAMLQEVDREIAFQKLGEEASRFEGTSVLLGGVIVETTAQKNGTLLEIYQTKIDRFGHPFNVDLSLGRFLAFYDGFLDGAIYRPGRKVTLVGRVEGQRSKPLGKVDYSYPYLLIREIYLFKEPERDNLGLYPWGYQPYWYGGWHDPYWSSYHRYHRRGLR